MKHAITRLREELRALNDSLRQLERDPGAAGGLEAAIRLQVQLRLEVEQVETALQVLGDAQLPDIARSGTGDWDRAVREPWTARKVRRAAEQARA